MNNNYLEFLSCLKNRKAENFLARTKNDITVKTNIRQVIRDTSWIEMIEETIPYLDNIVRNPRKFIVQEEDIIPIEKTKKITQESVKHLARHTSLIQDVDKDGMVQPLKLLNVYREETTDLYENRFIYSLLTNLKVFLNEQLEKDDGSLKSKYEKVINYSGNTKLKGEDVSVDLKLVTNYSEEDTEVQKETLNQERVQNIVNVVDDFLSTPFVRSLNGATPVRSPIRKTNVILKDQNFIKAVALWEFLEKYNIQETVKTVDTSRDEEVGDLASKYALSYYVDYFAASNIASKEISEAKDTNFLVPYLRKVIEEYVSEEDTTDNEFKTMIAKEFKNARKKQLRIYKDIHRDYKTICTNHKERVKKALSYFD
jgi:hypothetical protein